MKKNSEIKILLVDDDLMSLESLSSFLTSEGYCIEARSDIDAALTAIEQINFDVVASDYMLKGANGLDLISHVKYFKPDTFTILFTGYSSADLIEQLKSYPVDLFLTKPLVLKEIINLFETLEKKKRSNGN